MTTTTISPDMNMPVPVVSQDPGPDWATNVNACLNIIDSHNHSTGQGVQITPDGIDINADLPFNGNNATTLRTARFSPQSAVLALAADLGCLYEVGVDLYFNDGAGNQIRITQSGAVTGSTGTITGLPSGTASASYSGGTFTFQSATNTPATMSVGPIIISRSAVSPKTVTISASGSQAANYAMTLPLALPSVTSLLGSDASGNLSFSIFQTGTTASTFSWNGSGGTSSSVTLRYSRVGDWVTIFIPAVSATTGTSSTALTSNSPLASWAIVASAQQAVPATAVINAGSVITTTGMIRFNVDGTISLFRDPSGTAFSNSGTAGLNYTNSYTYYVGTGS